jgi:negative regulator of genetic competence, sporulation and motility
MRRHINYYYKCYDKKYESDLEKNTIERFNEYGYNFDCSNRRIINYDEVVCKTNYKNLNKNFNMPKK